MQKSLVTVKSGGGNGDDVYRSEEEMRKYLSGLCYGDLCIVGKIWIHALRTALLDARMGLIPVVNAAPKEVIPKKPPPMKYKDLPIYQSPHYEYKDYLEDKEKCPNVNVKILQTILYPKVANCRKHLGGTFFGMTKELGDMRRELYQAICKKSRDFKKYMRDPENESVRKAVVALGTATGFYLGSGTRGITKKLFFSTLGALATGALCFPKETDEVFRNVSYNVGKLAVAFYNSTCRKNYEMRERLPCPDEIPPPPPPRKANQINKHCLKKK